MKEGGASLTKVETQGSWGYYSSSEPDDVYIMDGPCGYLSEDGLCTVYEDPRKPSPCSATKPEGRGCDSARKEQKLIPLAYINPVVIFELDP